MDIALLILRVVIGVLMFAHGTQKLFGWFNGPGLEGTTGFLSSLGYRRPQVMAPVVGTTETLAGLGLATGFATPLAAAGLIGVMLNAAVAAHGDKGPWISEGGWEYTLVLGTAAAAFAFAGPGPWSLDAAIGWDLAGPAWGVGTIILGVVAASAVLATREQEAAEEPATADEADERAEERAAA